jgi:hypothetical protein
VKFTRTSRLTGNCILWSPQKLWVLAIPLEVNVMIVIDTPFPELALNCTMLTSPLAD